MDASLRSRLRKLTALAAVTCTAIAVLYWAALQLVGERWWLSGALLYAPHLVLLVPTVALLLPLLWWGPRRLLPVQGAAGALVVFQIMGLTLAGPAAQTPGAPRMRILSANAGNGGRAVAELAAEIARLEPDLVLLQESAPQVNEAVAAALPGFHTLTSTQFFVAARDPITNLIEPPKIAMGTTERSPRFIQVTLHTALGELDVFNVHPISPRDALEAVRGDGLGAERGEITSNTELRRRQVQAIAAAAATAAHPVVIAGDTNLPHGSRILAESLSRWQDGFAAVGRGFGYTFPVGRHFAWMRIDRILAGPELRFLRFGTGHRRGSDHYLVWADVERPPR